jgi:hypothetical protein
VERAGVSGKEDVVSFWQRVGRVTAALVRMVGGTANADWHVAARSAGPPRRPLEPAAEAAPDADGVDAPPDGRGAAGRNDAGEDRSDGTR